MKILLVFSLFLVSVGGGESRTVRGYPGGGVLIRCRYDRGYTSNPKYLCIAPWPCMTKPVWTDVKNEWRSTGRFSLLDNTSSAEFWVMIRDLTVEDSGSYNCAVDIYLAFDVYTPVELTVEEDTVFRKSISESGYVGGSMNISCKYPQSHSSDPKFLCRRVGYVGCAYKTPVNENRRWITQGKFALHDDRAKRIFTVSVTDLSERDSGEYWCGAESDWTSDNGYKVYITQVNLRVTERAPAVTSSSSSPAVTSSSSSPASTTSGNFSLETSKAFPASSVITGGSVVLVLLLIGLVFFIIAVRRRLRSQDPDPDPASTPTPPVGGSSNNYGGPIAIYGNITDTRRLPDSDAGVSTVCRSAGLPTMPSDPSEPVYNNVCLPTSPSDVQDSIYSNVQVPAKCSDICSC